MATWFEPAVIDLTVPASLLYALWVLTRPPSLPMRLPRSAECSTTAIPSPARASRKRAKRRHFHRLELDGQELWITAEDARQHITIPGTTGAGKTTAILSLLANALAQGSGFVLVDGKADRDLFGKVLALARRFGREDDVRVLNFMVASGIKDSHTFNPLRDRQRRRDPRTAGQPARRAQRRTIRTACSAGAPWRCIGTIAPVLVWLRDHKGVPLNIDVIRFVDRAALDLEAGDGEDRSACAIRTTGIEREIDVSGEIPEDII